MLLHFHAANDIPLFALSIIVATTMNQKIKHFLIKTMQRIYEVPAITEDYVKFVLGGIGKILFVPENASIKPISDIKDDQIGIYGEAVIDTMQLFNQRLLL